MKRGCDSSLEQAGAVTIERLGASEGEVFVVVYNSDLREIAQAIASSASLCGCRVVDLSFPVTSRNGAEPPPEIAAALSDADAAAMVTKHSLSHTRARIAATKRGSRIAGMSGGMDADIFRRLLPSDYTYLKTEGRLLADRLSNGERCRIMSNGGTDAELVLRGRIGFSDDGDLRRAGAFGNLPAGEAYIAPYELAGEGVLVFDGSLTAWGLLEEPLHVELSGGRIVAASGGAAAEFLLTTLDAGGPTGRQVAELGIGTNPAARVGGRMIEDEKTEGTIHVAFGTNVSLGGSNYASVHIDGVILHPTVELDGAIIVDNRSGATERGLQETELRTRSDDGGTHEANA